MIFTNQDRSYAVGAQLIGPSPIYRPMAHRCAPQADKSAMGTINRPLQMAGEDVVKNEEALINLVDSALLYISRVAFVEAGSTSKQARYGKPGLV